MVRRKARVGRPPLPKAEKQSRIISVRFTPGEFREVKRAKPRGMSLAGWVRACVLEIARDGD